MSSLLVWSSLCAALLSPASAPSTAPATRPVAQLSPDDVEVINLCLVDLRAHAEDPFRRARGRLVVVDAVVGERFEWVAHLRGPDNEVVAVPAELADAWLRRSSAAAGSEVEIDALREPGFVLIDLTNEPTLRQRFPREFEQKFGAAGYVKLWLPAFNADRDQALMHVAFGFTPHGASATYLLTKEHGRWVVTLRHIAYGL